MELNPQETSPLFQQIATQLREAIFIGAFKEGEQIPSTNAIAKMYQINPATVLKGVNILVNDGLLEKKRGIGMFVTYGATEKIREQRRTDFLTKDVSSIIQEAKLLGITEEQFKQLIERGYAK